MQIVCAHCLAVAIPVPSVLLGFDVRCPVDAFSKLPCEIPFRRLGQSPPHLHEAFTSLVEAHGMHGA